MGIIIRQSFQNSLYSYTGVLLGFVNLIWLYPYILESEEFGLTRVLISLSIVSAQFAHLGMGNATIKFFPTFRSPKNNHYGFLFIALVIPLIGYLIFTVLFFLFKDYILHFYADGSRLFGSYYISLLPLLLFVLYFNALDYYARSLYNTIVSSFLKEVLLRLVNMAAVLVYYIDWVDFTGFLILFILGYGLQTLLLLLYIAYIKELHLKPDFTLLDRQRLDSMLRYSAYSVMGGVTAIALGNIDIMMLGGLAGLSQTAIYAVAFYIATVITIPARSIIKIAHPLVSSALAKNDLTHVADLYHKSSINQLLLGSLIFSGIWVNIHHVMNMLPEEYGAGKYVILFIGLAKLFDMATGVNGGIIINSKYYRFDLVATLFLLIMTVIFNLVFIPLYGINGAAFATALSIFIYNSAKFYYVWVKFDMQPFTLKTCGIVISALGALFLANLIPYINLFFIDLVARSLTVFLVFGISTYWFRLSEEIIDNAKDLTRSLRTRL